MSTYIYLVCLDHDPPLIAEEESGQHLYDLPQIRADIAARDALYIVIDASEYQDVPDMGSYFRSRTARFLAGHRKCRIGIRDECGTEHPTTSEGEPGHA